MFEQFSTLPQVNADFAQGVSVVAGRLSGMSLQKASSFEHFLGAVGTQVARLGTD